MIAIATVAALAACNSHGTTSGAPSPTSAAGTTTTSTGSGAGAAKSVDVCTVLPVAQAAQLSGQPYTTAAPVPAGEGWASGCAYNNDDATAQGVNVNIATSDKAVNTWNLVHTGSISEVSGLGDKAFWDNDNTLYAMSGAVLIQVNGLDSQDKSEALAKVIIDALH
jgi:hypothetical protein